MTNPEHKSGSEGSFFVRLIRTSIILQSLDRFCTYIYQLIKSGFFGYIFSGYRNTVRPYGAERISKTTLASHLKEIRFGLCRHIEISLTVGAVSYFTKYLLGLKMKFYGTWLASFGVYTAITTFIYSLMAGDIADIVSHPYLLPSVIMILSSLPLVMSKKTLSEAIRFSFTGSLILRITGFSEEEISDTEGRGGHLNTAFFVGLICGAATYAVSPVYIVLAIAALLWAYLVMIKPELGVLTLFFIMPMLGTMYLAAIIAYTTVCYFIKLLRGKRVIKFEPIDITVIAFAFLLFFGGIVSLSKASIKPALLMVCLILGYFLTVQLITTREWLVRCSTAVILSAVLISLYGIYMYYTGGGYSSDAWLDSEMFESIRGRAVSTLENPNMLGEYLILIIPIAFGMLIGRKEGMRRLSALVCIGIMGICLILTWSRGAWLGLIFGAMLMMFMWHRRSVWMVLLGGASIPFLPYILPASIISRFTSIGNMTDSSTSYRVSIWRATVNMIKEYFVSGIGVGEGAWRKVYPMYSYNGIEAAPHSHNLYLQIWLELGIAGIGVFLLFVFLLYQSGFTMFKRISGSSELESPDISENVMKQSPDTDLRKQMTAGKTQLRISAAAPLCGIFAVLVQGMTDYSWYNYRIFLMFWLVCGLASAYIRDGMHKVRTSYTQNPENSCIDL